jgi:hypothetical protein
MELVDMNSLGLFDFFNFIRSSRIYLILPLNNEDLFYDKFYFYML